MPQPIHMRRCIQAQYVPAFFYITKLIIFFHSAKYIDPYFTISTSVSAIYG